jgi:hypothetical protein
MLERVSAEVMARRERMAARVRDELATAGLPIRPETMAACLGQPGAEVSVEYWDADGIPVTIDWQPVCRCTMRSCVYPLKNCCSGRLPSITGRFWSPYSKRWPPF